MFRFVYAIAPGDPFDAALAAEGFIGVESDRSAADGVAIIGCRGKSAAEGAHYVVWPAVTGTATVEGVALRAAADQRPETLILVENGGAYRGALDLWTLLEAARHPRVKIAVDADRAIADGQRAAVIVPTLNLRIGLVRVRQFDAEAADYARRLAGIGFEGFVVIDPPAGADRQNAARAIAAAFRDVLPSKPVKKAPAKAASASA
jgi:hypothetical protein